ncbi:hypothetical protein ACD578_05310 [Microvirga sp. RSM25]|uniref:hypothetical protein n=1 Tax=Microvirga sp. RSM25 TaxID=3273802 RepID=UPI00384BF120
MTNVVALRTDIEPSPAPEVPSAFTFREMVDTLISTAEQAAFSLNALHQFALRDPTEVGLNTITAVQRECAVYFDLSNLLRALEPHEDFIRQIAARAETQA